MHAVATSAVAVTVRECACGLRQGGKALVLDPLCRDSHGSPCGVTCLPCATYASGVNSKSQCALPSEGGNHGAQSTVEPLAHICTHAACRKHGSCLSLSPACFHQSRWRHPLSADRGASPKFRTSTVIACQHPSNRRRASAALPCTVQLICMDHSREVGIPRSCDTRIPSGQLAGQTSRARGHPGLLHGWWCMAGLLHGWWRT